MIVFKLYIFLTLFLLTNQEYYWNFFPSNEFSTSNKSAALDLKTFTKGCNSFQDNFCVILLTIGHVYSMSHSGCCGNPISPIKKNNQSLTSTSCHLNGEVDKAKLLKNSDNEDDLIFFSFDGCYTTDANGSTSEGTFLVTNNISVEYNKMLNNAYFWTNISSNTKSVKCNMLCDGINFNRCYEEQTEDEMEDMRKKYIMTGYTYAWLNVPIEQEKQEPNWIAGNELTIAIVIGVVLVVVFICFVIYNKLANATA